MRVGFRHVVGLAYLVAGLLRLLEGKFGHLVVSLVPIVAGEFLVGLAGVLYVAGRFGLAGELLPLATDLLLLLMELLPGAV